ncbi:hypothetical protein Tco_0937117 [Tanacetum coccineum]|uniref:Uncharacterized protein n=1 Tax=Tanacetum coccineum TaxID=301880 RepID=A0ABQ5DEF9_9ASTR
MLALDRCLSPVSTGVDPQKEKSILSIITASKRDSLNLLPGTLQNLAMSLCPDLGTKGSVDHESVNEKSLEKDKETGPLIFPTVEFIESTIRGVEVCSRIGLQGRSLSQATSLSGWKGLSKDLLARSFSSRKMTELLEPSKNSAYSVSAKSGHSLRNLISSSNLGYVKLGRSNWKVEKQYAEPSRRVRFKVDAKFRIDWESLEIKNQEIIFSLGLKEGSKRLPVYDSNKNWVDTEPIAIHDLSNIDYISRKVISSLSDRVLHLENERLNEKLEERNREIAKLKSQIEVQTGVTNQTLVEKKTDMKTKTDEEKPP